MIRKLKMVYSAGNDNVLLTDWSIIRIIYLSFKFRV